MVKVCAAVKPDLTEYDRNRTLLYEALTSYGYECVKPQGAFYLFVKAPYGTAKEFSDRAKLENLLIDYDRRQVRVDGSPIHVTQTEYNILALLSQHTGKVLTYSAIIRAVWGTIDEGSVKKLQVNMANLRKKLGCQPGENRYIINELGVGYRMLDAQD